MLTKLLENNQVVAVLCNQFGDTGKGKIIDSLSSWADVIARGTGGNNAGHTIFLNEQEKIFHIIPSGIVHKDKLNILGNGMVIDVNVLVNEIEELKRENLWFENIAISQDAFVIMPWHIEEDRKKFVSLKKSVGSTGRGIGPAYSDKIARTGIKILDLMNEELFWKKIEKLEKENYKEDLKVILSNFEKIKIFVKDTKTLLNKLIDEGKKILIEGAQGLFLSIEHGTYPFVTSSDPSLNGTAAGVGISAKRVDLCLGLIKFPFMTRVGSGPFFTEIGGKSGEDYCADKEKTLKTELDKYSIPYEIVDGRVKYDKNDEKILELVKSSDELKKNCGIRLKAGEFGATTGRLRRVGWTDAVLAKYATRFNGTKFVLTKVDSFSNCGNFAICYGYESNGEIIENFSSSIKNPKIKLKWYEGYGDISKINFYDDLPISLKNAIKDFEEFSGGEVVMISKGPKKDDIIFK